MALDVQGRTGGRLAIAGAAVMAFKRKSPPGGRPRRAEWALLLVKRFQHDCYTI